MKIGVLAMQGAFIEHIKILEKLGIDCCQIRQPKDFTKELDGLIIPGGESTVIGKLLIELKLWDPIQKAIKDGFPVFGTCAGLILLAKTICSDSDHNDNRIRESNVLLNVMDITVKRNAYGRQLGSFLSYGSFDNMYKVPMIFIRAPYIENTGSQVEILSIVDGNIVAAKQNNMLVTAFHPELTNDTRIHEYFINMIL